MTEALADFVKESPQHLKRVHIVIFQSNMLPDFQDAIKKLKKISTSGMYETVVFSICDFLCFYSRVSWNLCILNST